MNQNYTIKINPSNRLSLTDHGKQIIHDTFFSPTEDTEKQLAGYPCFFNPATNAWQHNQSFGSKEDYNYGTNAGVILVIREKHLELSPYAHDGMTGLEFTEKDKTKHSKNAIDETINYTLKLVQQLIKSGLITIPKRWLNH